MLKVGSAPPSIDLSNGTRGRYYGYYSNVSREKRQETAEDDDIPCIIESEEDVKAHRTSWSLLIQKIYETDPLVCPKCQGTMRIISSIEDGKIIKAILKHLGLWHIKSKPPPKAHGPPSVEYIMDDHSQILINADHCYRDPDYPCRRTHPSITNQEPEAYDTSLSEKGSNISF